ncbi:SpoIIE family protein phosphatase [Streptomyces halobius]|uniref:SpoIIE family protein phosphatase n=1 Tax=Streptomyces halobius TaxID=2879846 RepID=A0ABY4M3B6_9ACTN|nr:SpoIIE family protein phosphatase [Streptomyces halobius]UQA92247.1 SpoIIE family protein phosphatase [Streptomyces halobius]
MERGQSHGEYTVNAAASAAPRVPAPRGPVPGRIPLAVVVVGANGRISHWSSGARRLFGPSREEAVGSCVLDLLPVTGALGGKEWNGRQDGPEECHGPGLEASLGGATSYPTAGRARMAAAGAAVADVLWWAYPLVGPGEERLLVLAADAAQVPAESEDDGGERRRFAPAFALHTELPGSDELARRLPHILPSMSPQESARIVAQVLELGYPVLEVSRQERFPVTPDWGVPRRVERRNRLLRAARAVADDPRAAAAAAAELESDLEYAAVRERLEFLNEVSGRIGSSLDLARTIQEVSEAVVPRFTDVAGTYLREQVVAGEGFPDGPPDAMTMWHRVAVEHNDEPGRWDDVVPVGESMTFPVQTPFFQCMTTGQPVLVPRISEEMGNAIAAQFEKRDISPLINGRSLLVVPLKARNVVLGFMILLRHPERTEFNDMDRVTGAELAARAGLVLDNARMYTFQENVAETLQDSMLPHIAPRMAGCDTATRYLPGTRLGRVGGDWFDTIKLPGSRTALVVGDVMGHGLNSAAMMGQLRTAVQTMAAIDMPPAQLLRGLDDLAQRLGDNYLATCLYAVYDPIGQRLTIANAGHIPPVLVRAVDGRSELLRLPTGAPIGVGGVPFEAVTVPVEPGDRLVLCTDGLVEVRGRDIGAGLAALAESAAHPAASMDDACDAIIRALNVTDDRKDDVALLMARLNGIAPDVVAEWRLAIDPQEVSRARRLTGNQLARWGLHSSVETAQLMVSEVVTNAVRHAHTQHVVLRLVHTDALLCEVSDDDHALPQLLSAGPADECGRGLRVVSRLAREWGTSRTSTGKTVWFEQSLPRAGRPRVRAGRPQGRGGVETGWGAVDP